MGSQGKGDIVMVAASKHRSSLSALEWALQNKIATPGSNLKLVHIRPVLRFIPTPMGGSVPESKVNPGIVAAYRNDCVSKTIQDLRGHENLCRKWKVHGEFLIVEGDDIAASLLGQVLTLGANKFVIGKARTTLLRKLKGGYCIPNIALEYGSNFCTVYVIANGKLVSLQRARNSLQSSVPIGIQDSDDLIGPSIGSISDTLPSSYSGGSMFSHHDNRSWQGTVACQRGDYLNVVSPSFCEKSSQSKKISFSFNRPKLHQLERHLQVAMQMATIAKQNAAMLNAYAKEEARKREAAVEEAQEAKRELAKQAERLEFARFALEAELQRGKSDEVQAIEPHPSAEESLSSTWHREYCFEELQLATDNFAFDNKIGEGGYGYVYKGRLDHTPVAIKVLKKESIQGLKQFQREIEFLGRIRHPNIVLLLGACPEQGCLVYEYLANGSLEERLLCNGNTAPLPWQTRCLIVREIATALLFLHSFKPNAYVHRDLKPANILLGQNLVSKLGDVGLAALAPNNILYDVTQYKETSPVGTFAYIDPEYKRTGVFTPRSDGYALGVVMLQILTGKSPFIVRPFVKAALKEDKLEAALDASAGEWPLHVATGISQIAIRLCRLKPRKRPDLKDVLPELEKLTANLG